MLFVFLVATILATTAFGNSNYCPEGWSYHEGSCIKAFDARKSFADARKACQEENGDLIMIKDSAQNGVVAGLVNQVAWIGVSDDDKNGQFTNVDGSALGSYHPWYPGEPNNWGGREQCVMIYGSRNRKAGKWNDAVCDIALPFVCSFEPCPNGWDYYAADNICIKSVNAQKTFSQSREACKSEGADLMQITNEAQMNFILSFGNFPSRWIGVTKNDNQFEYLDGTEVSDYQPWSPGEPNNAAGNENCVLIYGNGKWNDDPCSRQKSYICSKQSALTQLAPCPSDSSYYEPDNVCIKYYAISKSFLDARSTCKADGGDLVKIKDVEKTHFLLDLNVAPRNWVGFWDEHENQHFTYIDGSELGDFKPWNYGEPNNWGGNEHCGMMYGSQISGHWNDAVCSKSFPFICEKGSSIVHCKEGWSHYEPDNICIKIFDSPKTFHEAEEICQNSNGNLLKITSDAQTDFIFELKTFSHYWIGVWDVDEDEQFTYIDGTALGDYQPWHSGEPNNWHGIEHCGELYGSGPGKGKWNDADCWRSFPFVCSAENK